MSKLALDEIKIVDDHVSDFEILRELVDEKDGEVPLHVLNVGEIIRKHKLWIQQIPRVVPHYAVKCNPHPTIIKIIAALGGCFDCASKGEIIHVMKYAVSCDRIIFAQAMKFPSHVEYARKVGVAKMTADSEDELKKIKEIYPDAKIVIRIRCDSTINTATTYRLGEKFGCDPSSDAVQLIKMTLDLGLTLHGFSFHAGSPCGEPIAISRGINWCQNLIDIAKSMGCKDVQLIDIGGGIPGERDFILDEFSDSINNALENVDSSITIISEPGRYYVASACTSAAYVLGKKTFMKENKKTFTYYISDGVYGSFGNELVHDMGRLPINLNNSITSAKNEKYLSTIWGPTCDSYDLVLKNYMLPEFNIGDWLVWLDIGAYSTCRSKEFNGFQVPKIHPFIRRKDWNDFFYFINKINN